MPWLRCPSHDQGFRGDTLVRRGVLGVVPTSCPRQGSTDPLLRVVSDFPVEDMNATGFTQDGRFVIWGSENGSVTVCNLIEVDRELSTVSMDWQRTTRSKSHLGCASSLPAKSVPAHARRQIKINADCPVLGVRHGFLVDRQ